jgi:hypothetical protein
VQSLAELATTPDLLNRQRRILLVDATQLRQIGGSGDDWRAHLAYELLAGRMGQVRVTDRKGAEKLAHFELHLGDIAVGDSGYGYRKQLAYARLKQADVVLRVCLATFPSSRRTGWYSMRLPGCSSSTPAWPSGKATAASRASATECE